MSEFNFHLLVNQHGERFIFYKSPNGEKIIEDFAKIPYTAESLFEDIMDEFSAFPWEEDDSDNEYNDNDVLVGRFVDDFTLHEAKSLIGYSLMNARRYTPLSKRCCVQINNLITKFQ